MSDEFDTLPAEEPAEEPATAPGLDPLSRWLLGVALVLVIVLLVTGAFVVTYVFALRDAPRTNAEYVVLVNRAAVTANPSDAAAWGRLAYAYEAMGRTSQALAVAEQGRKATASPSLLVVRADILRLVGRYADALATYNAALAETDAAVAAANLKLKNEGVSVSTGASSALTSVYFGRALTKHAMGDRAGALADLGDATKYAPDEANLWALLGDYQAEAGQWKSARASYQKALAFVPGLAQATAGLERLQKGGH